MNVCATLVDHAAGGAAAALRAVDCLSATTSASVFARLFGPQGALVPVLAALLGIDVALFGLALIAGRSRLGLNALVPRLVRIGVVFALATSWIAWQTAVWQVASHGPDSIASLVTGTRGSATDLFARRVDTLFSAVDNAAATADEEARAKAAAAAAETTPAPATVATPAAPAGASAQMGASFGPASIMWLAALLLLLGTVGVLVTARIVLAVLLLIGPVMIVLALFAPARGLTLGWVRATVLAALVPLIAATGGAFSLELAVPAVARLVGPEGIDGAGALGLFLIATVHVALMVLALGTARAMVSGIGPTPARREAGGSWGARAFAPSAILAGFGAGADRRSGGATPRADAGGAAGEAGAAATAAGLAAARTLRLARTALSPLGGPATTPSPNAGIGTRFRAPPVQPRWR